MGWQGEVRGVWRRGGARYVVRREKVFEREERTNDGVGDCRGTGLIQGAEL